MARLLSLSDKNDKINICRQSNFPVTATVNDNDFHKPMVPNGFSFMFLVEPSASREYTGLHFTETGTRYYKLR